MKNTTTLRKPAIFFSMCCFFYILLVIFINVECNNMVHRYTYYTPLLKGIVFEPTVQFLIKHRFSLTIFGLVLEQYNMCLTNKLFFLIGIYTFFIRTPSTINSINVVCKGTQILLQFFFYIYCVEVTNIHTCVVL